MARRPCRAVLIAGREIRSMVRPRVRLLVRRPVLMCDGPQLTTIVPLIYTKISIYISSDVCVVLFSIEAVRAVESAEPCPLPQVAMAQPRSSPAKRPLPCTVTRCITGWISGIYLI